MFVHRKLVGSRGGAARVWPWCPLVVLLFSVAACDADQRCSSNAECETGQVCSNEKNPLGDGVCISPCTAHPNTPACPIDAGPIDAAPTVDASVDAAPGAGGNP